jgi:hypothetical protein
MGKHIIDYRKLQKNVNFFAEIFLRQASFYRIHFNKRFSVTTLSYKGRLWRESRNKSRKTKLNKYSCITVGSKDPICCSFRETF